MPKTKTSTQLWNKQDELNVLSHPLGSTVRNGIECGERAGEQFDDYKFALLSEISELQENYFWKHWSKEAKEGKRFRLLAPRAESGIGSFQNVRLEIVDILFFTVSLLQVCRCPKELWSKHWESEWPKISKAPRGTKSTKLILQYASDLMFSANWQLKMPELDVNYVIDAMKNLCAAAGLDRDEAFRLYKLKLKKNIERQLRGRRQVGDKLAEIENKQVR